MLHMSTVLKHNWHSLKVSIPSMGSQIEFGTLFPISVVQSNDI